VSGTCILDSTVLPLALRQVPGTDIVVVLVVVLAAMVVVAIVVAMVLQAAFKQVRLQVLIPSKNLLHS
jgi:hypothetical protein